MHYTFENLEELVPGISRGNYHANLMKILTFLDPGNSSDLSNWIDANFYLEHDGSLTRCSCSHQIMYEYRIRHSETLDTIGIGSKCIKLFHPEMYKNMKRARLRRENLGSYCSHCDEKVSQPVLDLYADQTEFYHKKCLNIKFKRCGCGRYEDYDCKCKRKICLDCDIKIMAKPHWSVRCFPCYRNFKINGKTLARKKIKYDEKEKACQLDFTLRKQRGGIARLNPRTGRWLPASDSDSD